MDGWDMEKWEVYKKRGVYKKMDLKQKYPKIEVLNRNKENIKRMSE